MHISTIFDVDWAHYAPALLRAALKALEYTGVSFVGATVFGLVLALLRLSRLRVISLVSRTYTELLKNMPFLVPVFVIYFGLPSIGLILSTFEAGCISLIAFYSAYFSEIFRGALQGVSSYQHEAAKAAGLNRMTTFIYVIIPQAARLALPAMGTMLVDMVKGTSLLMTISGAELMTQAQIITSDTFRPLEVYIVIGAVYFCLCFPLSLGVSALERSINSGKPLGLRRRRLLRLVIEHRANIAHNFEEKPNA